METNSKNKINIYINKMLKYNNKINIISRKITNEQLNELVDDTLCLIPYINQKTIVDMGSGNGLLGIVIALANKNKKVILVDSKEKKINFLKYIKNKLEIKNIRLVKSDILSFIKKYNTNFITIVSRGFTGKDIEERLFENRRVREIIYITSNSKINNLAKKMDKFQKNVYNIKHRDILKIIKMENVSRETKN